jgi:hypothetical protein
MLILRLVLTVAAILWGVQFLVYRERWAAWGIKYGTKNMDAFWRASPYIFALVSFWWALLMLTTGLFGAVS